MKTRIRHDRPPLCDDYVLEGQFFAWPLAVQGECEPIDPDSAHVCALAATPDGRLVWGATRGQHSHLFAACFKGASGGILDLGMLPEGTDAVHLLALPADHPLADSKSQTVLAAASSANGFSLWSQCFTVPRDAIQEPAFTHRQPKCLLEFTRGTCLGLTRLENTILCLTTQGLVELAVNPPHLAPVPREANPESPPAGTLALLDNSAWWLDTNGRLCGATRDGAASKWKPYITDSPNDVLLIAGPFGNLLAALPDGTVLAANARDRHIEKAAVAPLPGVHCLAPLPDGRIYGLCGSGIGHFFRIDIQQQNCTALGAIATALGNHRYAFTFACAEVTRDGVILFGEDDRGGHLWTYYPPKQTMNGNPMCLGKSQNPMTKRQIGGSIR